MKDINSPLSLPRTLAHELTQLQGMLGNVVCSWETMFLKDGMEEEGWGVVSSIKRRWRRKDTGGHIPVSVTATIYKVKCIYSSRNSIHSESSKSFKQFKKGLMLVVLVLFKNSGSQVFSVQYHFFGIKVTQVTYTLHKDLAVYMSLFLMRRYEGSFQFLYNTSILERRASFLTLLKNELF